MLLDAGAKWTAAACTISASSSTCPNSTGATSYGNKNVIVLGSGAFDAINNSQANLSAP
jgi:hypothetical protein